MKNNISNMNNNNNNDNNSLPWVERTPSALGGILSRDCVSIKISMVS